MSIRAARDSFLKLLSDNIDSSIPIHNVRHDNNNDDAAFVQVNAVNVHFMPFHMGGSSQESSQQVAIDILHNDDLTALDWAQQVATVLLVSGQTPMLDYSQTPAVNLVGKVIRWDQANGKPPIINFRPVTTDGAYVHLTCLLTLKFIS